MENFIGNHRTAREATMAKAHADVLATKAGTYYKAKSTPRNFCKAVEEVAEGLDLLKAFDDACSEGMDPSEGSNLIVKCAGAMGGPMSGPLAATLATRPVKKMADGTIGAARPVAKAAPDDNDLYPVTDEMRAQAREIIKHVDDRPDGSRSVHTKSHYRVRNGRVEYIQDYDSNRHGVHREASLQERSVRDFNRNGEHYIRATDSEDRDKILRQAEAMGIQVATHRASGGNHHGRNSAYPHIYFHNEIDATRVHSALEAAPAETGHTFSQAPTPETGFTITPAQVAAAEEPAPATIPVLTGEDLAAARSNEVRFFSAHRAGLLRRRVWMDNVDPTTNTNKFYAIDIRQVGPDKYVVNVAYGRNGAVHPSVQTKTSTPVSLYAADAKVDQLRALKARDGYGVQQDGVEGITFSPLDNYQHSSVVPVAQQQVEARAAAMSGGIGAPPRAAPAVTNAAYDRLATAAYAAGNAARNVSATERSSRPIIAEAIRAHQEALTAAESLGIHNGSDRGTIFHQDRLALWTTRLRDNLAAGTSNWTRDMTAGFTRAGNAMDAVNSRGEGFADAVQSVKSLLDLEATRPEGADSIHTPVTLAIFRQKLPVLGGGVILENALRGATNQTPVAAMEALHTAIDKIVDDGMFDPSEGAGGKIATMKGEIVQSLGAIRNAVTKAAHVETGEAEPEEALEAIRKAHRTAAAITAAAASTGQPWAKVVERIAAAAVAKVATLKAGVTRIAGRPRVADLRYANTSDPARQQSDASHAAAQANPASHAHHRTAFDHAKRAAVATYHEALQHKGADRQRLQALANTYAERARTIAAGFATIGRR